MISSLDVAADCGGVGSNHVRQVIEPRQHVKTCGRCLGFTSLLLAMQEEQARTFTGRDLACSTKLWDSRTKWPDKEPIRKTLEKRRSIGKPEVVCGHWNNELITQHAHYVSVFLASSLMHPMTGLFNQKGLWRLILSTLPKQHCSWLHIFSPARSESSEEALHLDFFCTATVFVDCSFFLPESEGRAILAAPLRHQRSDETEKT